VHLDTIKVYYSPTNAQVIVLKNSIKIYIKLAPKCFGPVSPSSGGSLSMLAKVTLCEKSQLWFISIWLNQWWCGCIYWSCPCWCVYVALFESRQSLVHSLVNNKLCFKVIVTTQQQCINMSILLWQHISVLLDYLHSNIQRYAVLSVHIMYCGVPFYLQGAHTEYFKIIYIKSG